MRGYLRFKVSVGRIALMAVLLGSLAPLLSHAGGHAGRDLCLASNSGQQADSAAGLVEGSAGADAVHHCQACCPPVAAPGPAPLPQRLRETLFAPPFWFLARLPTPLPPRLPAQPRAPPSAIS
jgi:hypothetical protein